MIAQRLLEGEAYVTISLVPYMVYKVQKGLQKAIETPTSSCCIKNIAAEMKLIFNTHFGEGVLEQLQQKIYNLDLGDVPRESTCWH
jgi:hypothetical protein